MVKFKPNAVRHIQSKGFDPRDVNKTLERLVAVAPHIRFSDWHLQEDLDERSNPTRPWAHYAGLEAHCHLVVGEMHIACQISARIGTRISKADLELLDLMLEEARALLGLARESSVLLGEFGLHAISQHLAGVVGIPAQQIGSCIKFLRSLSGETYENQRISYGIILTRKKRVDGVGVLEFDNKRFKRLTDGFSTALVLDAGGGVVEIAPLSASEEDKKAVIGRPWWLSALADTSHERSGLGLALTKGGDILVVHERQLLCSQRAGEWRVWRHQAMLGAMLKSWQPRGRRSKLHGVIKYMYRVALELAFRRSGALIVVAESRRVLMGIVNSKSDVVGSELRSGAEQALDESIGGLSVLNMDRRVVADIAGLDGALVVDRAGYVLAYGAMVKSKKTTSAQGARTRAAIGASALGLAIKVSSDGGISVYRKGKGIFNY